MNRRDFLFSSGAAVSLGLMARGSLSAQTTPSAPIPAAPAPIKQPTPVTEFKPLRRNTGVFTG
ncbi:MAG TPA: MBL fold metallo-hydrolase, partial [Candidatus Didemnitutus sp.]|nr:MBL fold metallo-hydrolase [Candidatus Didemnitutus sp.]